MKKILLSLTIFLLVAACQPTPPSTGVPTDVPPLPTYTALPPLPTYTPYPTQEPLWTLIVHRDESPKACYATVEDFLNDEEPATMIEWGRYVWIDAWFDEDDKWVGERIEHGILCWLFRSLDAPTLIPPTAEPTEIEPTAAPQVGTVKVLGTVNKLLLREVCWNTNGFIYNAKGFPIMSDCIYPIKGAMSDRIKYMPGNKIEVELLGDVVFAAVHGFRTNANGVTVKADGGERYFVATERGANGELLFVAAWLVNVIN